MKEKPTIELVYEAVCDLHRAEQPAAREVLAEITGLKLTTIDDRLKVLVNDGRLRRLRKGFYAPYVVHPPARVITMSALPDGCRVLEIGDSVNILTPNEYRTLSGMVGGSSSGAELISVIHEQRETNADLIAAVSSLKRSMTKPEPEPA